MQYYVAGIAGIGYTCISHTHNMITASFLKGDYHTHEIELYSPINIHSHATVGEFTELLNFINISMCISVAAQPLSWWQNVGSNSTFNSLIYLLSEVVRFLFWLSEFG